MRHGSLFSGIGGFDLAAQWMGWENVFHCESNEFGQKILKHYWPQAISYTDIIKTDFTKHENSIDIISGGFPCQPFSVAGDQQGTTDDRFLWPEMLRAIKEVKPRWIVGENVPGIIHMALDEVLANLEDEGYQTETFVLPACSLNAPHRRDRVWIIAHSKSIRKRSGSEKQGGNDKSGKFMERAKQRCYNNNDGFSGATSYTNKFNGNTTGFFTGKVSQQQTSGLQQNNVTHTNGQQRCEGGVYQAEPEKAERYAGSFNSWDDGGAWKNFPTQPPVYNGDDGVSERLDIKAISKSRWRTESIKAGGNAIVPQMAFEIFQAIEAYEMLNKEQGVQVSDTTEAQ